jgi:lipoprotein-anchoring transpeptidase ErfK/SrfK
VLSNRALIVRVGVNVPTDFAMGRRSFVIGSLVATASAFCSPAAFAANSRVSGTQSLQGYATGSIIISIDEMRLFFVVAGAKVWSWPIAVPIPEYRRLGRAKVMGKVKNPSWRPTPGMRAANPEWPAVVPAGPTNPLGPAALYLNWPYIRIHGNNDPTSVGTSATWGCYRMLNNDIAFLFSCVRVGADVFIV